MQQRHSPPKHRHDGTSPLPLGMDWTPPPRLWAGRETVWPHDPSSGWSYCVTIPSWNVLAKSRDSDPTVFYRVQIGLQSPEGITTTRTVLRRFNDFLKLQAALKRLFPRKNHPPAPPKGLLRLKTRAMLEERRSTLEEWMTKLLSDIDVSRSVVVASFLELESAARSSFQEDGQPNQDSLVSANSSGSSLNFHPTSNIPLPDGSPSLMSDYGSDIAYETSEIGTTSSLGRDNGSEIGLEDPSLEEDLSSPIDKFVKYGMSNIDEGLSMGHAILDQLESLPKHKVQAREFHNSLELSTSNGSSLKTSPHETDMVRHVRKLSNESIGSDRSSQRGNELTSPAYPHSNGYGNLDFRTVEDSGYQISDNVKLVVPLDQRQKLNRLLTTMERRLITAKTDMEDLMSRLNQEVAVKDYLATKVKDLEVELETTKQKGRENLEQAILIERERVTQMQWDMEELRRKSMEMELKLNSQQVQSTSELKNSPTNEENVLQQHELDSIKKQFEDLSKRYQQLEVKSKADIKILVKEVKSLRSSQGELKQHLNQSLEEKSKTEELFQEERKRNAQTRTSLRKLLSRCKSIHDELQECNVTHLLQDQGDDLLVNIPSASNLLELVATSDNQIGFLLAEAHRLDQDVDSASTSDPVTSPDDEYSLDEELKHMLSSILVDSGVLRKQVNSLIARALGKNKLLEKVDTKPGSNVNEPSEI